MVLNILYKLKENTNLNVVIIIKTEIKLRFEILKEKSKNRFMLNRKNCDRLDALQRDSSVPLLEIEMPEGTELTESEIIRLGQMISANII